MKRVSLFLLSLLAVAGCGQASSTQTPALHPAGSARQTSPPDTTRMAVRIQRTDEEWRRLLTPEQYRVLRAKGTEAPFANEYDRHFAPGTYACAACGQELFPSATKFPSGCGWPAFYAAKAGDRITLSPDHSHGMVRTEVSCARCGSHLGHLFDDAPQTPTGQRYCINSLALKFIPAPGQRDAAGKP